MTEYVSKLFTTKIRDATYIHPECIHDQCIYDGFVLCFVVKSF